jgi:hypothetical protein
MEELSKEEVEREKEERMSRLLFIPKLEELRRK